jgi:predicted alpha/beta hydrolase family esterase
MMKRAVILHGTDGAPEHNWFPWLKAKLEAAGYQVWIPLLPGNHTPNREVYNDFLFSGDWDFTDNIVVGHSSGAVSVLNLLMDRRCPKAKLVLMVSAWAEDVPNGYDEDTEQFANLFPPDGFDFEIIKRKADRIEFLHSKNDPYCPLEDAKYLADELSAGITIMDHGVHLGSEYTKLPEVWKIIEPSL